MLFTSAYILNYAEQVNQFQIHPFCHSLSNVQTASDATRSITIPDVSPSETLREGTLSMAAGDFLEIGRLVLPVTRPGYANFVQANGMRSLPVSLSTRLTTSSNTWKL